MPVRFSFDFPEQDFNTETMLDDLTHMYRHKRSTALAAARRVVSTLATPELTFEVSREAMSWEQCTSRPKAKPFPTSPMLSDYSLISYRL